MHLFSTYNSFVILCFLSQKCVVYGVSKKKTSVDTLIAQNFRLVLNILDGHEIW